jgi:hypothetical protein
MRRTNSAELSGHRISDAARWMRLLNRAAIVLLLLAVPFLSTLAKKSWYLPQSETAHYLNGAVKMKVAHGPVLVSRAPARPAVKTLLPQLLIEARRPEQTKPSGIDLAVLISLRHRSPPLAAL